MPPAARVNDKHMCPMQTPGVPPIPHAGGGTITLGCMNVLIGGMPAARLGDMLLCTGPPPHPDTIVKGSSSVLIGGMPAARMGDTTSMGGTILLGEPTVEIGG